MGWDWFIRIINSRIIEERDRDTTKEKMPDGDWAPPGIQDPSVDHESQLISYQFAA